MQYRKPRRRQLGYGLESPRFDPGRGKRFSLLRNVSTGYGDNTAFCSMGTVVLSRR